MRIGVPIGTERLALRRWKESDFDPLYEMHTDPGAMRFPGGPIKWTREHALDHLKNIIASWDEHESCDIAMALRPTDEFVGWCAMHQQPELAGAVKLGGRIRKQFWGRGLATEAREALLKIAFGPLRVLKVVSRRHPESRGMLRVFDKLGMSYYATRSCRGLAFDQNAQVQGPRGCALRIRGDPGWPPCGSGLPMAIADGDEFRGRWLNMRRGVR
jgi:RimJ/RimL family protein N-acetyltransferase